MRIILEKTVQRFSTATDYVETLLEIIHQRRRISEVRGEAPQGTGNGLDRSERVVDLVAQYTNNFLPSQPFFPAQGFSRLGEHDKTMGHPILAEIGAANDPALLIVMKRGGYSRRRRALPVNPLMLSARTSGNTISVETRKPSPRITAKQAEYTRIYLQKNQNLKPQ